jgi:hypothetical protein
MPRTSRKKSRSLKSSKAKLKKLRSISTKTQQDKLEPEKIKIPENVLTDENTESKYSKCIADSCYYLPVNTELKKPSIGQSPTDPYELSSQPDKSRDSDKLICIKQNRFYDTENNTCTELNHSAWDKIHAGDKFKYCGNNYMLYNPERNSCTTAINDFKYYTAKIEDLMLQKSNNMNDPKIKKYINLMISIVNRTLAIIYSDSEGIDIPEVKTPEDYYKTKNILYDAILEITKKLKEEYNDPEIDIRKLKFYKYLQQEDKI